MPQRVFLSHTSDLGKHTVPGSFVAAAVEAVLRARHAVTDMAYFAARDSSPAAVCEEMVTLLPRPEASRLDISQPVNTTRTMPYDAVRAVRQSHRVWLSESAWRRRGRNGGAGDVVR